MTLHQIQKLIYFSIILKESIETYFYAKYINIQIKLQVMKPLGSDQSISQDFKYSAKDGNDGNGSSIQCKKVEVNTEDPLNVKLQHHNRIGNYEAQLEYHDFQIEVINSQDGLQEEMSNHLFSDSKSQFNPWDSLVVPIDDLSEISISSPFEGRQAEGFRHFILQKKSPLNQTNNFPKKLIKGFSDYVKKIHLQPEQKDQLHQIFQELHESKFQKAGLRHFQLIFNKSAYHHHNRRLLYGYLIEPQVQQNIIKSNAIKKKINKLKYLLGIKMSALRCCSSELAIRIQTRKDD